MRPHLPSNVQLIVSHKVGVISLQRIQDECFIRFWDLGIYKTFLVRQVHFRRQHACVKARSLRIEFEVHGFGRLYTHDEFVASDICKDSLRDILELNANFHFGFVEGYLQSSVLIVKRCFGYGDTYLCLLLV